MRNRLITKKTSQLEKLYVLPSRSKLLISVGFFFFICVIGFSFLKIQSENSLSALNQKKMVLEKEVTDAAAASGAMDYLSKNKTQTKAAYEKLMQQLPPESTVGDLLASITKLGTTDGLKFVYFKPKKSIDQVYYAETPVEISVTGQFHQLGKFLSGIANFPNALVVVKQFSITSIDQKNNMLSLELTATLYYALPHSSEIKI